MALRLMNTLTGKKEEFQPLHPPKVALYVCGLTVYDDCHIGHARGGVVFDVLRRFLESRNYSVTHVRNITDVDDKIINRARQEKASVPLEARVREVAGRYTERFKADFARLGLLAPHQEPRATEFIPQMAAFIEQLVKQEIAYEAADGVYFSVRKLPEYGRLSHQKQDEMLEGTRAEAAGEGKKDPLDFALWKRAKPEEPSWPSPWGAGRPGWHIECTAMSTRLLGDAFDIHGGGQDLVFPHHENERAQALGAGKPFARVWLHNGLLTVNGQKMSKSLGNFVTIEEALKRHPADVLRFFFLSSHYRSPVDFSWERLDESAHAYERLTAFLARADAVGEGPSEPPLSDKVKLAEAVFLEAMEDDLNTPRALAALFELIGQANDNGWLEKALMKPTVRAARGKLRELGRVLGFFQAEALVDPEAKRLARERDEARSRKDYAASDEIRKQLTESGYVVEDTPQGTVVRKRI